MCTCPAQSPVHILLAQLQTHQQPDATQVYLTLDDLTDIYDPSHMHAQNQRVSHVAFKLTENQASTAISTVMDFAVAQVVEGMLQPILCLPVATSYWSIGMQKSSLHGILHAS